MTVVLATSLGVASPAVALPERLLGVWCYNNNQERMIVDEFGFGFNEHTVCDTKKFNDTASGFTAILDCKNTHISGDDEGFTDGHQLDVAANFVSPNLMTIQLSADEGEHVFIRCDG